MNIINPLFKVNEEKNIFTIREKDYDKILDSIREIVNPVEEIGFTILEVDMKDSRFSSGELSRTLKQTISIKLQKGSKEIDLSLFIPKLIEKNYIFISGRKKIPLFQLYDLPIVTRGESIKLRTNVATLMLSKSPEKESPFVYVSFLGKKIPLALLLIAYFGIDEIVKKFDLSRFDSTNNNSNDLYNKLLSDLKLYQEESEGYSQEDFLTEIGRLYSKYNAKTKGEDIIYALNLIPKVDPITASFLTTPSILEELVEAIKIQDIDDTLFINKRVRCFEYAILAKVSKIIFDLCYANRTARQPKFSINSTQILSDCNVSDIVQFDFSINPIEELTKLSRVSLLGPGGFKRENIPKHLRDICPSMFGRVCPVDTPDRDNCGVLQNLLPNVDLDEKLRFTDKILEKQPISIPVSMVPFLKNDDQTRLQMSSSQMRQAVMLKEFDIPMISSGSEGLYTDFTQFVKRAKQDGYVVHADPQYLIVCYNDGQAEIINISYRKIYVENLDYMPSHVKTGDKFKKGDILAESNFCKDGKIMFGKNLLTGVMVHYGNNYEDGIVISDRLVKEGTFSSVHYDELSFVLPPDKVLLSLSEDKYEPLPLVNKSLSQGNPYAIIKKITKEEPSIIFSEEIKLLAEKRYFISEVNVYANEWNTEIPEFRDWIEKRIVEQQEREKYIQTLIYENVEKDQAQKLIREHSLDKFSLVGKYKEKKERVNGIIVEITGIHTRNIQVGDKIANRHGNKGVISKIIEHEKMPQLEDGRHIDICINPMGINSRMNIGQIYELHLAMSLFDLKMDLLKMIDQKRTNKELKAHLLSYIKIIDKTEGNWYLYQFQKQLPEKIDEDFVKDLTIIQAPFESCKVEDIKKALAFTKTKFKQEIFDPLSKEYLLNPVAVGFIYFFRMVHIAEEKLAARGIGPYTRRTLQPLGGRKHKGGQRCGEMETACLIGHDAPVNLFEFLTTKSDCIDLKNNYIRNSISGGFVDDNKNPDMVPESVKLLDSYLTVIGIDHKK